MARGLSVAGRSGRPSYCAGGSLSKVGREVDAKDEAERGEGGKRKGAAGANRVMFLE